MNQKEKTLTRICEYISNYAIHKSFIDNNDFENFRFGLEVLLSQLITFFTIVIIGIVLEKIILTIIFLIVFISFRSFKNNFHCRTFFSCFLLTNFTYLLCMIVTKLNISILLHITFFYFFLISVFSEKISSYEKKNELIYMLIAFVCSRFIIDIIFITTVILLVDITTQYYKLKTSNI